MFLLLLLLKLRVLLKSYIVFIQGRKEFSKKNDFDSSSYETSTEITVKQNQRKSRVKGKPKKKILSDEIIEFQNEQRQQIRESEIRNQEFMQQLITQQIEDDTLERERGRAFLLELSKILKD